MAVRKTRVEFLAVLLPRLESMRRNVALIEDASASAETRREAARLALQDICTSFQTFAEVDLPDVIGARRTVIIDKAADTSWLISLGKGLNSALTERGLHWPAFDAEPPGLACDLVAMYDSAVSAKAEFAVLSAQQLRESLKEVGTRSCNLSEALAERGADLDPDIRRLAVEYGKSGSKILAVLGVVAIAAEALALPGSMLQFGPDIVELGQNLIYVVQATANHAADLGGVMIQSTKTTYEDWLHWQALKEQWISHPVGTPYRSDNTPQVGIEPSPPEIQSPPLPGYASGNWPR